MVKFLAFWRGDPCSSRPMALGRGRGRGRPPDRGRAREPERHRGRLTIGRIFALVVAGGRRRAHSRGGYQKAPASRAPSSSRTGEDGNEDEDEDEYKYGHEDAHAHGKEDEGLVRATKACEVISAQTYATIITWGRYRSCSIMRSSQSRQGQPWSAAPSSTSCTRKRSSTVRRRPKPRPCWCGSWPC